MALRLGQTNFPSRSECRSRGRVTARAARELPVRVGLKFRTGSAAPERGRYQRHLGGDRSQRHCVHLDSGLPLAHLGRTCGLGLS